MEAAITLVIYFIPLCIYVILPTMAFGVIFRKAGYSGWMGLLMLLPIVNLITLFWFALATWPIEHQSLAPPTETETDMAWEMKMLLRKAVSCERRGKYAEAVKHLEEFIATADNPGNVQLARAHLQRLQQRMP
jgi:hypothetical protein